MQYGTIINFADSSRVKYGSYIHSYIKIYNKFNVGVIFKFSVKEVKKYSNYTKGSLEYGISIRNSKKMNRLDGSSICFGKTESICYSLVEKSSKFNKIYGPIPFELNIKSVYQLASKIF
uniref:Ribosomal protein L14 n=1 Tax=Acavomonas peruviana TaxID=1542312 RepID=V5KVJ9_9ALVE|nr:ribosomal protein L14 [Acavomonas peruviana]